ncbi:MAG: SprB repeat-containing protein [Bacteroidetes bacterium]|nr:SprB repeat-containing protein [Bacteroidota bacterium]
MWSTTATTQTINGLAAGTYTVTVTDQNSCTNSAFVTLTNSSGPNITLVNTTNVSCNGGNNGAVNISVSGGLPLYNYLWSNGALTQDISNVASGTYTVTVTDALLCTATLSFTVTQPTAINASVSPVATSCGLSNGSATANAIGGTGTFTYLWSNAATTQNINGLAAGTYTVTVTDQNLCTSTANGVVASSTAPSISLVNTTNVSCNGGSNGAINISVANGTLPYGFLWSNGATTEDISGVVAGTYTITVTDGALCTSSQSFTVTQPTAISVAVTPVSTTCGLNNGSATANPSGGTGTFTYLWSTTATTQTINNLAAGTYTVTVTDQNLCTRTANGVVASSTAPSISLVNTTNVSCNGGNNGAINISVANGTLPYGFLWSNGATTEDISGVVAGTYSITVTDGALCTASQSFIVTQPTVITVSVTPVSTACGLNNGSATANPSGGTGTLPTCGSTTATTQTINNLAAGTYTVTVTDQNLCTKSANGTVNSTGTPVITLVSITNVSCNGGSNGGINISVSSGTLPYGFLWE